MLLHTDQRDIQLNLAMVIDDGDIYCFSRAHEKIYMAMVECGNPIQCQMLYPCLDPVRKNYVLSQTRYILNSRY